MTAIVLLCADRAPSNDSEGWLPGTVVRVVPALCRRPDEISALAAGADHLVVGVCPEEFSLGGIQKEARKLGLDALGVGLIDMSEVSGDAHRLRSMVAGAVARAAAFEGSRPEHAKITVPRRVSRRSLLTFLEHAYVAAPDVEQAICAAGVGCHACVDACPRGALKWSKGTVSHDSSACEPCGICVAACPTGAMLDPACTPAELAAHMSALLDRSIGPPDPRGIVFTCDRATRPETDPGWFPVHVPCTGMVTGSWLLAPLLMGAAAVAARPCGDGGCPLNNGDRLAGAVAFSHACLEELGLPADHVRTRTDSPPGTALPSIALADPFGPQASATVLAGLAAAADGPSHLRFAHTGSPTGVMTLRSDACTMCTMCAQSCPTGALAYETVDDRLELSFDASHCTACAQCLPRCPESASAAISLSLMVDLDAIARGRVVIGQEQVSRCERCGTVVAPTKMLVRLQEMIGDAGPGAMEAISRLCIDCRGLAMPTGSRGGSLGSRPGAGRDPSATVTSV